LNVKREADIETIYFSFLDRWNNRDAAGMAAMCSEHAYLVGFDGSELRGRDAIKTELSRIFTDHKTLPYVAKVRSVETFEDVAILHGVVGMVDAEGQLKPEVNAIQTCVVSRESDAWRVEVLQSTPAAFHGRPEARERLTEELREVLRATTR
jgi:uncharacterized protein (TIGR02246 family)